MTGLSIAPTPMQEAWRPTLQRVAVSGGGNRVAAASPSLLGAVAATAAAATAALAAIPVPSLEVASKVTLAALPPSAAAEEERETELPASLGRGLHGSPSRSTLKVPGDAAGSEPKHLLVTHEDEVVDIPSDDEADDVELPAPSQELAVVRSEAGPSSGLEETDLVWPYPEDPTKVWFVLWA